MDANRSNKQGREVGSLDETRAKALAPALVFLKSVAILRASVSHTTLKSAAILPASVSHTTMRCSNKCSNKMQPAETQCDAACKRSLNPTRNTIHDR